MNNKQANNNQPDDKLNINQRSAGVLLHISSLPAGDLGADAYRFIDFLASAGVSVWQTLPINMPHSDNSPYQCLSAHAGNPAFISLHSLVEDGLIEAENLAQTREEVLQAAHSSFTRASYMQPYQRFCATHQHWLEDFALYLAIRQQEHSAGWFSWPAVFKNRDPDVITSFKEKHAELIDLIKFTQFLFFKQWLALKEYAQSKQVKLFGDIPIFVAYDSADVWARPDLFKLDAEGQMTVVAGVPPDYFSATGQRWGNPHYNWPAMAAEGYAWWLDRIRTQAELFDLVRIDHFRGLEAAWEIAANEVTATNGNWVLAPGDALIAAIKAQFPEVQLIAEDLGIITAEVEALRQKYALPGMKILQFAFNGDTQNPYLPANIDPNSVVYTGTHDNDTTLGWYWASDEHTKGHFHQYINHYAPTMPQALIEVAMHTVANLAIIPMQDILALGSEFRMNTPGTTLGNWNWKFGWDQLNEAHINAFSAIVGAAGRAQAHG